jgi:hypothetical protein
MALTNPCDIHGFCGKNGLCIYALTPTCTCPKDINSILQYIPEFLKKKKNNTSLDQAWFWPLSGSSYLGSTIRVARGVAMISNRVEQNFQGMA